MLFRPVLFSVSNHAINSVRCQLIIHVTCLGLRINGLVTYGNTKLCCQGFVLALFQSTTANKIDSEQTRDYPKLFPVCKVEILQVTVNKIEVL